MVRDSIYIYKNLGEESGRLSSMGYNITIIVNVGEKSDSLSSVKINVTIENST